MPEDDGIELVPHPASLGLFLDLVAIDHPATVWIGAQPVPLLHRPGTVVLRLLDDLERAVPVLRRPCLRNHPHAGPLVVEPPVGR